MNRTTVALLAALDALIVAAIGIGVALVPLTVLWAAKYHLALSWLVFWRAAGDIWLLGHGVNLTVALPASTALSLGLPTAAVPFQITVAALGLALLTVLFGVRTGIRASETSFMSSGVIAAVAAFGAISTIVTLSTGAAVLRPSIWQGVLLPMFVFAVGILIGVGMGRSRMEPADDDELSPVMEWFARLPMAMRVGAQVAFSAGTAASALVLAVAGLLLALLVIVRFTSVVALYEGLQAGALGGFMLTLAQLAFLPNLVIWVASWLVGPGFALGTGTSVSAVGAQLGPIPSVPLLGALPPGQIPLGFIGILVPVLAGFVAALFISSRLARTDSRYRGFGWLFLTAISIGIVAGIELGLLAWWSSGAIGPGRLHTAGPDPWMVGLFAAGEIAVAAVLGMLAGGRTRE